MFTTTKKNQRGFTLIELLAVMAIVAVLAGIVSVAVGGTGETSKDTQTKQDATTIETAAADYFSDQEGTEVLTPKTIDVLGTLDILQGTSSRWPEQYITDAYPQAFPDEGVGDPTVNSMFLLKGEDGLSSVSTRELLENFNAVDFSTLIAGDYLAVEPDGATQLTADKYSNYLWLLKKTTAAGGSGEGAARQVAVFKLISVQEFEGPGDLVDLTYLQLVSESPDGASAVEANNPPVPDASISVIATEDIPSFFALTALDEDLSTLEYDIVSGSSNGLLLPSPTGTFPIVGTPAEVSYIPNANYVGPETFEYSVFDGEFTQTATVAFNVTPVNDPPQFNVIADPASVTSIAGIQTIAITGVAPGPLTAFDESSQTVVLTASVTSSNLISGGIETTLAITPTVDPSVWNLSYTPALPETAQIEVIANDGQVSNNTFSQSFTVQIVAP